MVKNLPSVERSTKIRFGKHVPDSNDQEENTIVFNASNVTVPTPYSNAVYLSPIRNRTDYTAPSVVLLMYDRDTKEITESGETANALIGGSTLNTVANRNNATSNVVQFIGSLAGTSFVTDSNIGISNLLPQHTISVGSNLYIDEFGSNVLVVSGNVAVLKDMIVEGNLTVNGDTTVIYTENTSIKDAFIELGRDNTSGDTTLDLGVLMHRPDALSNVVVGYREGTDEFTIAYTDAKPTDKTFTPKTDEDINVHVYGLTHVDANIYAHEDVLVTGNTYVSGNISVTDQLTVTGNVYADKDFELAGNAYVSGNVVASKDLTLAGNAYVSGNVNITKELTVTGNVYADKDFELAGNAYVSGNVNVTKQLSVTGNAYVSGNVEVTKSLIVSANTHLKGDNVFITHTMDFLDPTTAIVTDQVSNVQIRLGQLENVANTVSNPLENQVMIYDGGQWANLYPNHSFLTIKNDEPTATLVSGNAVYISGYQNENLAKVKLAKADSPTTMPSIGIVYNGSIAPGGEGLAVAYGKVNQMNTNGYNIGETLYVSNTYAGWISNVKPYYTDSQPNLIQNIGVVTRKDTSHGAMFVTGIGRANDIPNATVQSSNASVNYVYVNSVNNDFLKIDPMKLPTKLQPLTHVVNTGNTAANAVTLRGLSITSGDGFHGDIVAAGNVTVDTNTFKVDAEANRVGILTASPGQTLDVRGAANVGALTTTSASVTDTTHSTSKDTGVLIVTNGGLGVEANIHSTNVFAASHIAVGTSATTKALDVRGTSNVGVFTTPDATVTDSTAATSKTTGALKVTGGVGIQGDIHATHANLEDVEADSVNITDTTAATDKTTGALKVAGGVGIQGDLYATNGIFTTNVYITDHTDLNNKYLAMIDTNGSLIQSPVYVAPSGKYVITAAEAEFLGNITLGGNTTVLTSNSLIVQDRIIAIGSNNSAEGLDSGIIIEHQDEGTFANIALIHHANEHRFSIGYTQNTLTDNHILNASHPNNVTLRIDLIGNTIVQNSLSVSEIATFGTKVGIATTEPIANIHVVGNVHVTSNISTASNVLITGDAVATSKTTGALQVTGGAGIQGDLYATNLTASGTVRGATLTGTNLYGTIAGSNTAAVSDLTASGTVRGATLTGTNLYGTIAGSNTAAVSDLTATGTVKGATLTGTNLYGTISGSNTAAVSDLTASGTVKGATLTGTNLYGTIAGSNTAAVSDLTASGTVRGATLTGTNLYGTISGSNTAAVSDLTATGTVKGATLTGTNLYGTIAGSNTAAVSDLTATGTVRGATLTGTSVYGAITGSNTATVTTLTATDTTQATSTTTGALKVAGGISSQKNIYASNVYITGGIITNTGQVTKKTYSYSGALPNLQTIANSTIKITFSNHVFYAKVVAHLVESDDEVSTLAFECGGGNWGGTAPANNIALGPVSVFGGTSTNPWNSSITTTGTTVAFAPTTDMAADGHYNVFIEYISQSSSGVVTKITEGTTDEITFNY